MYNSPLISLFINSLSLSLCSNLPPLCSALLCCRGERKLVMENMVEKAKEELEMLEKLHPDRFDYLKLELKSFISLLQSQSQSQSQHLHHLLDPSPSSSTATTQASTSMKRKRACFEYENHNQSNYEKKKMMIIIRQQRGRRDRVDVVLEKAQACLRKIKDVKCSFFC